MNCAKRTVDMDQSVDTFAVCTNCSRLSCDLHTCDKCGSLLSDDNMAHCYSSEPKRLCTETQVNGKCTQSSCALNVSSISSSTVFNSEGREDSVVIPQALYVNVNNQAFPVIGVGTATAVCGSLNLSRPVFVTASVNSSGITTSSTCVLNRLPIVTSQQTACVLASGSNTVGHQRLETLSSQINLPSYNLQPPPPPFAASIARLPGIVSGSVQAAVVPTPSVAAVGSSSPSVQVSAVQIRIGIRKFKPSSAVTFKDDGILFTLKDYTYAPVLLNARAIVKCKANLSTFSYPVLFLFLESSCMRQIRNIFGLTANDFSHSSPIELKRCISIFPVFGVEGKSQAQSVMYTIKRSFEAMVRRYPRSSSILEDISNDQTIDLLLELACHDSTQRNDSSANESPLTDIPQSTSLSVITTASISSFDSSLCCENSSIAASQCMLQNAIANGAPTTCLSTLSASTVLGQTSAAVSQFSKIQATAPILQIPSDQSRWQLMQKGLVANGVYHVLMPNGHRQYCLWNGKQLVPCLVQNTEVQLSCMRVRIGSLLAQSVGQIRVKAEQSSGIHFTIKSEFCGTQEIAIAADDINTFEVCFSNIAVLFLTLNSVGADKLRKKLKLHVNMDPGFDSCGSVHLQYVILCLNNINRDQEEALMHMKFLKSGSNKPLIEAIDISHGIRLLAQIKLSTTNETTVTEFLSAKHMIGTLGFERLVNDIASSSVIGVVSNIDDDDDVIMTQEEVGMKCPYTQQVMKNPVRNVICNHNYERLAIQEFILRKKGNAKCPYAGCANLVPLRMEDLVDNAQLRDYISKLICT